MEEATLQFSNLTIRSKDPSSTRLESRVPSTSDYVNPLSTLSASNPNPPIPTSIKSEAIPQPGNSQGGHSKKKRRSDPIRHDHQRIHSGEDCEQCKSRSGHQRADRSEDNRRERSHSPRRVWSLPFSSYRRLSRSRSPLWEPAGRRSQLRSPRGDFYYRRRSRSRSRFPPRERVEYRRPTGLLRSPPREPAFERMARERGRYCRRPRSPLREQGRGRGRIREESVERWMNRRTTNSQMRDGVEFSLGRSTSYRPRY